MRAPALLATTAILFALGAAGCATVPPSNDAVAPGAAIAPAASSARRAALQASVDQFAVITMAPDTRYLSASERQVTNLLIEAAGLMTEIYRHQYYPDIDAARARLAASDDPDRDLLLKLYDLNFGPWDQLKQFAPFIGTAAAPEGAGLYPEGLSRADFDAYLTAHPAEAKALTDPYTVVRRQGDRLVAVPYSTAYARWLEPAAVLLERAAAISENTSLANFLRLRAAAFRSNDYYPSELAWMEIQGTPIEPVIGPYEVYTDRLYGQKTAFEAFITLENPAESARLARFKALLPALEAALPVPARYKNANRPFNSPIIVADEIQSGGDAVPGVQTTAFNLPNDERVRAAKGAKKVILANVLDAKFRTVLAPIASRVLAGEQATGVTREYMFYEVLFHELSHSLGPGIITVGGRETTVNAELKEIYSASEECKADVMGVWAVLELMRRGELPASERPQMYNTYFAGIFRTVRHGIDEAHGRGAAVQYSYLKEKGAFTWNPTTSRYVVDYAKMEAGLTELVGELVRRQGDGDYTGMKAFLDRYAHLDANAEQVLATMHDIPTDIAPFYPQRI